MKRWLIENWDKLVGFLVSGLIAGIIGFFSAIRATEAEINELRLKVATLEADSKSVLTLGVTSALPNLRKDHDSLQQLIQWITRSRGLNRRIILPCLRTLHISVSPMTTTGRRHARRSGPDGRISDLPEPRGRRRVRKYGFHAGRFQARASWERRKTFLA
jgi:hypothetical protein